MMNSDECLDEPSNFTRTWFVCCLFLSLVATTLTLQLASTPVPPAQIILSVTRLPHQSDLVQVGMPTTGRWACCRMSAMGPPALEERTLTFSRVLLGEVGKIQAHQMFLVDGDSDASFLNFLSVNL